MSEIIKDIIQNSGFERATHVQENKPYHTKEQQKELQKRKIQRLLMALRWKVR